MSEEISLPPLFNGLDYMRSAVRALAPPRETSEVKYAALHLVAAIEVIAKYRLLLEHWTLVVSRESLPRITKARFASGDFKSVTLDEALDRLSNVVDVSFTAEQLDAVKILQTLRNRMQHFGVESSIAEVESVVVKALTFLLEFIDEEITWRVSGSDSERFESEIAEVQTHLGTIEQLITVRMAELASELDRAPDTVVTCPRCGQMALQIFGSSNDTCLFCTAVFEGAEQCVAVVQGLSSYEAIKGGDELPLSWCPDCLTDTVARRVETRGGLAYLFCFACGEHFGGRCMICGTPLGDPEQDGLACSACLDHRSARDD